MIGNPRLRIEITVNVTGIGIGIKVNITGIRIGIIEFVKHWNQNWNRNHMILELESELESLATGIGIMDFGKPWNRNQNRNKPLRNRNHWSWNHLLLWHALWIFMTLPVIYRAHGLEQF